MVSGIMLMTPLMRMDAVIMMVMGYNVVSQIRQDNSSKQERDALFFHHRGFKYNCLSPQFKGNNCSFVYLLYNIYGS
jgi:hypothetical protein